MATERLQPHEMGNQSDQTHRDASSSSNGYIRDFATRQYEIYGQQQQHVGNGKDIMTSEMEIKHIEAENEKWKVNERQAIEDVINERGGKTSGEIQLKGEEGLKGAGKLKNHHWDHLDRMLDEIKELYNAGYGTEKARKKLNAKLKNLSDKVDNYMEKGDDDDEIYLNNINGELKEGLEDVVFINSINRCKNLVEDGRK